MVIYDFHICGPRRAVRPFEANPPLPIDADAELPGAVALEGLEAVTRHASQVVQAGRRELW